MAVSLECELQALGKFLHDLSTAGHNEEDISAIEDQQVVLLGQKRKGSGTCYEAVQNCMAL
eukprot:6005851-Lingulodinium_polyedra.AAC.1